MRVLYVNHTAEISGGERSLLGLLGALPASVQPQLAAPAGPLQHAVEAARHPGQQRSPAPPAACGCIRCTRHGRSRRSSSRHCRYVARRSARGRRSSTPTRSARASSSGWHRRRGRATASGRPGSCTSATACPPGSLTSATMRLIAATATHGRSQLALHGALGAGGRARRARRGGLQRGRSRALRSGPDRPCGRAGRPRWVGRAAAAARAWSRS